MSAKTYILGSDWDELERLRFQHKVWSKEAFDLWSRAGISLGDSVLDIGSGPGFASADLAAIVGPGGFVMGLDKTPEYNDFARNLLAHSGHTNHTFENAELTDYTLPEAAFDFVYSRWVFSWINDPKPILEQIMSTLKPGGSFLFQEYMHWATLAVHPKRTEVDRVITACRQSWENMPSEINIGPTMVDELKKLGFRIQHIKVLPKIGRPSDMVWQWPGTFLTIYSEKLVEYGLLTREERSAFIPVWNELEQDPAAFVCGPLMLEVIAVKP